MNDSTAKDIIVENCEYLIEKIKDIVSAKVITTEDGKISEIHVISNSERDPKQIVRDIESALIASLGSNIDQGKISVAQITNGTDNIAQMRLKIDGIGIKKFKNSFEATVCLSDVGNNTYEGKASGIVSAHGRLRIVAIATLNAISKCFKDNVIIALGDVFTFEICNHKAVAAMVYKISDGNDEPYLGSVIIKQDICDAVVAAVLDSFSKKARFSSNYIY